MQRSTDYDTIPYMDILNYHLSDTAAYIWGFVFIFVFFLAIFRSAGRMSQTDSKGKYIVVILISALIILLISAVLVFKTMKRG